MIENSRTSTFNHATNLTVFIQLKNGNQIEIRSPEPDEARNVLDAMIEIASSSPYILSTSEDFKKKTEDTQKKWLEDSNSGDSSIILAAYSKVELLEFVMAEASKTQSGNIEPESGFRSIQTFDRAASAEK